MNSISQEKENKERRRVVFWLAGGVAALIAVSALGLGFDDLSEAHAANSESSLSHPSAHPAALSQPLVSSAELTAFLTSTQGELTSQTKTTIETVSFSPSTTPSDALPPTSEPTPVPVPVPTPTHSDYTNHDGHADNHEHARDSSSEHHSVRPTIHEA